MLDSICPPLSRLRSSSQLDKEAARAAKRTAKQSKQQAADKAKNTAAKTTDAPEAAGAAGAAGAGGSPAKADGEESGDDALSDAASVGDDDAMGVSDTEESWEDRFADDIAAKPAEGASGAESTTSSSGGRSGGAGGGGGGATGAMVLDGSSDGAAGDAPAPEAQAEARSADPASADSSWMDFLGGASSGEPSSPATHHSMEAEDDVCALAPGGSSGVIFLGPAPDPGQAAEAEAEAAARPGDASGGQKPGGGCSAGESAEAAPSSTADAAEPWKQPTLLVRSRALCGPPASRCYCTQMHVDNDTADKVISAWLGAHEQRRVQAFELTSL